MRNEMFSRKLFHKKYHYFTSPLSAAQWRKCRFATEGATRGGKKLHNQEVQIKHRN